MSQCPPALFAKLTLNGLMPDEATDRQGNCGIDAFARSLMAQMKDGRAAGPSVSARSRRSFKTSVDKVAFDATFGLLDGFPVGDACSFLARSKHSY